MPETYPKRPKFFFCKFVRLMANARLANEIGADGCWLLSLIALTEDIRCYRSPVTFYNEPLAEALGFQNPYAMIRLRNRVVESGWLHYEAGSKSRAGRYWVTIPIQFQGFPDMAPDEKFGEYTDAQALDNPQSIRNQSENNPQSKRKQSAHLSSLTHNHPLSLPQEGSGVPPSVPAGEIVGIKVSSLSLIAEARSCALPESLDTPEFRAALESWAKYRTTTNKGKFSLEALVKKLEPFGSAVACKAISTSMANGWKGLFPDKETPNGHAATPAARRAESRAGEFPETGKSAWDHPNVRPRPPARDAAERLANAAQRPQG